MFGVPLKFKWVKGTMVCHALRDLATTWPNRPFFLIHGRKVWTGNLHLTCWRLVLSLSSPWRVDRKTTVLVQYAFCVGMTGFPWSKPLMYLSWQTCTDLGWFSQATGKSFLSGLQVKYFWGACNEWRMWDCLLIAKPVAISHLGIHYDCC